MPDVSEAMECAVVLPTSTDAEYEPGVVPYTRMYPPILVSGFAFHASATVAAPATAGTLRLRQKTRAVRMRKLANIKFVPSSHACSACCPSSSQEDVPRASRPDHGKGRWLLCGNDETVVAPSAITLRWPYAISRSLCRRRHRSCATMTKCRQVFRKKTRDNGWRPGNTTARRGSRRGVRP